MQLQSILGGQYYQDGITNLNTIDRTKISCGIFGPSAIGNPTGGHYGSIYYIPSSPNVGIMYLLDSSDKSLRYRLYDSEWKDWEMLYSQAVLNNSTIMSELASALGAI